METEAILQFFSIAVWLFYMFTYAADVFDIWARIIMGATSCILWMVSALIINVVDAQIGFVLTYLYYGLATVTVVLIIADSHRVYVKHMDWW